MSDNMDKAFEQFAAFQKLWNEHLARQLKAGCPEDLIKTTATDPRASLSNLLKGKKGLVTG
ncbi:MAG TPA: hypothetical protein VE860_20815, partial [Chthoniobacterales bacterium]|nr:hypothetical protein [Chthoniobacterales bacterium]